MIFLFQNCRGDLKKIYIANDTHTDYMWTADEEGYRQAFLDMIDYYLDLAETTANKPADYQSRFNCDGSFWVWIYENNKSSSDFERLINHIKSGHIQVPINLLNLCYGGMPAEAVFRSMYYAGSLERRYDLRFRLAMAQENQTLPFGLGALWSGAGALYSWKGICGCASKVPDAWDRQKDIYWWVGPDGSRLLMKWNSMLRGYYDLGGYAEANHIPEVIDYVDTDNSFISRYPYDIIGIFGYGGDALEEKTDKFIQTAEQETTANRKVIVSNEIDYFEDFEKTYGNQIDSLSCSFGNEWDLLIASMAELSARVKRAVEKLRPAEALASLVGLQDPSFFLGREQEREKAWLGLGMYFDHDWTADGPISREMRAQWERRKAADLESYVNSLFSDSITKMGALIRKNTSNTRFFVFNSLSWTRDDFADFSYSGTDQIHVIDMVSGADVPFQIFEDGEGRKLRIWAENVPSEGYKVYEIAPGAGQVFNDGPNAQNNILENDFYRVKISPKGSITSLIDKKRGNREIARSVNGRWMNDLGSGQGSLQIINKGPVSVTIKASATGPLSHTTSITLFRNSSRVEIRNEINENFSDVYTWGFGFNLNKPNIWHEEVGAVIKAAYLGQGGHYSSRNARYDWLTLNHFADVSSGGFGATLSNADCYFMKTGNSTPGSLDANTPLLSILAGGQVDGPALGIPNQGNDDHFLQRFALESHDGFNPAASMRFALEHQNPFVTGEVSGGTAYPHDAFSFLEVDNKDVIVWGIKPSEDPSSAGVIVRLWNLSPVSSSFSLRLQNNTIQDVKRTTHIEIPLEPAVHDDVSFSGTAASQQWLTYALELKGVSLPGKGIGRKVIR